MIEDQNYLNIIKKFNEDSKHQIVEHKSAIGSLRDEVKNLKLQFLNSFVILYALSFRKREMS